MLPSLPALTRLTLDVAGVTALPPRLLANLPHLTHLQLHESSSKGTDAPLDLPADLLAGSPHLIELSLDMPRLRHIPAELLAPVPNLQRLYLNAPRLASLSDGFTDNMSQLTDVSIVLPCDLDRLPDDFLTHTPGLSDVKDARVIGCKGRCKQCGCFAGRLLGAYPRTYTPGYASKKCDQAARGIPGPQSEDRDSRIGTTRSRIATQAGRRSMEHVAFQRNSRDSDRPVEIDT